MNEAAYLLPALSGDKTSLSEQAREEIQALSGAKPKEFLLQAAGAWGVIIAIIILALYTDSIGITLLSIVVIGTRFNIFGLLVHEQAHSLGLRGKYGDSIANILVAYPLGITVEDYANVHLSHHKFFLTQNDPDLSRKAGADWAFPMLPGNLVKLFIKDLMGLSFIQLLKSKRLEKNNTYRRLHPSPRWLKPIFYLAVSVLLTYSHTWDLFLIYWIFPLISILPVVIRIGAICEHIYSSTLGASVIESTPIILLKWWEKLIIPDLNFKLHIYHHFYPGIAFCNLPKVHKIFQREHLVNEKAVFNGFSEFFKFLQTPRNILINPNPANKPSRHK